MKKIILAIILVLFISTVNAATLTCQQISSVSLEVAQFSSTEIEIQCTASGGSVSSIQITPNANPSSGLTLSSTQTISSSLSDTETGTAKWSATGDSPNDYTVSYSISSDGTNTWTGSSTTDVEVTSPAQLTVEYVSAPSTYSSGGSLNIRINNIGGTTANNIYVKLNSNSRRSYPSSIAPGASASYSWTSSTGYAAAGTYVSYVYIGDTVHDSAQTTVNTAGGDDTPGGGTPGGSDTGTTSSSTTSGGGGGGVKAIESWFDVVPGDTIEMDINNTGIALTMLTTIVNKNKEYMTLKVESTSTPDELSLVNKTYQYLEFTMTNFNNDDIDPVTMYFKVENTWFIENDLSAEDIILYRYTEQWDKLETNLIGEGDVYTEYSAVSPGFSYFAIAAKAAEEAIPEEVVEPINEPTGNVPDQPGDESTTTGDEKKGMDLIQIGLIVLTTIAVVAIIGVLFRNRPKKPKGGDKKESGLKKIKEDLKKLDEPGKEPIQDKDKPGLDKPLPKEVPKDKPVPKDRTQLLRSLISKGWNEQIVEDLLDE